MPSIIVCVLIGLSVSAGLSDAQCLSAGTGWLMSQVEDIGVCHYFRDVDHRQQVNYSTAQDWCKQATSVISLPDIRLARLITEQEKTMAVRTLTSGGIGYWDLWTDATCNSTINRFTWGDGSQVTELKSVICNSSIAVQFKGSMVVAADGSYKVTSQIEPVNTTNTLGTTMCEYNLPKCNMSTLINYNSTRMQPDIDPIAGRQVKASCAPGYYRQAEADGTAASKMRNIFNCTYNSISGGIGSAHLVPVNNTVVDSCTVMHCSGGVLLNLSLQVDFKETYRSLIDPSHEYLFGEFIPVQCKTGYVRITNLTDVNSTINCIQNNIKPSEGQWDPIFCTPVACNRSAMSSAFDYTTMTMYKAYDRLKDRTYTSAETHRFSYFPNTVYVRCATDGQFFSDRKYDKTFQCNLKPNSTIEAVWTPVEGTLESSMRCQPITCLTNELVSLSHRANMQDYLMQGNFNSTVLVVDETGLESNVTLKDFVSVSEYKYTVSVRFSCVYGYAMSAVNDTDGKMMSVTSLQSQCSPLGSWNKMISECIKMSAAIGATSGKKYIPEPKEAGSAQSLGAIVIVIVVVFFSVIVVLDIATLSRDIKLLKQNLKRLRLKAKMKSLAKQ